MGGLYGYTYLGGGETLAPTHGAAELAIIGPAEPAKFDGQVPATFEVAELVVSIEPLTVGIQQIEGATGGDYSLSSLTVELTPDDPVADITLTPDHKYVPLDESVTLKIPPSSDYNVSSSFQATAQISRPVVSVQVTGQTMLSGDTEAIDFTTTDYQGNPLSGVPLTVTSTNPSFEPQSGSVDSGAGSVQVKDDSDDPAATTMLILTYGPPPSETPPGQQPSQGGQAPLANAVLTGLSITGGSVTQHGVVQTVGEPAQWATVAQSGVQATVTALLSSPVDVNHISSSGVQWQLGYGSEINPLEISLPLDDARKDVVSCTINQRHVPLDLWIIWATVSIQTAQHEAVPATSPGFEDNFGPGDTSRLTGIFKFEDSIEDGQICAIAQFEPFGVNAVLTGDFGINWTQKIEGTSLSNGVNDGSVPAQWTVDGPVAPWFTTTLDASDCVYMTDSPNNGDLPGAKDVLQVDEHFMDYLTWGSLPASDVGTWHFASTFTRAASGEKFSGESLGSD